MPLRPVAAAAVACVLAVACTGAPEADPTGPADTATASIDATGSPSPTPTTPPSPMPTASPTEAAPVFGTGIVTVDGTTVPVRGDCDVSRDFGQAPVDGLDDEVDVLLAVDNGTDDGGVAGPFALRVRLLGSGAVEGRTITSVGAPDDGAGAVEATYEGPVTAAELRERTQLEFLDSAVLHLEATQERVRGDAGPGTRELVVDVACPVARPEAG